MAGGLNFKHALDPFGLFAKAEEPKVIPYPKAATVDPNVQAANDAASLDAARQAASGGRASAQITAGLGEDDPNATSAAKRLLGQ